MRNSTKLKLLLEKYDLHFTQSDDGGFSVHVINKATSKTEIVQGKTTTEVLSKAFSVLMKNLKEEEK